MKKIFILIIMLSITHIIAKSQPEDDGVKLDLLKAPSSPASNLLGIAASDVDKPTDVSAFMLSLQKSSNNFTSLPSNYSVDIAPYWLFKKNKKNITTAGLEKSNGSDVLQQTLVLSFAIKNTDSTETKFIPNSTYSGVGFKFSIFRGHYDDKTIQSLEKIKNIQDVKLQKLKRIQDEIEKNKEVVDLRNKLKDKLVGKTFEQIKLVIKSDAYQKIQSDLNKKNQELEDQQIAVAEVTELNKKIKDIASEFQTARVGFTWDIAGGISAQFLNKRFDNSKVYNAGIWTTLGYTDEKLGSVLFLLRFLHNPDKIFAKDNTVNSIGDIRTLDFGGRYIYSMPQSKFNASMEAVYRSVLSSNTIKPSWRLVLNADYAIWQNQKLTFSFGRNFDGTISKDGNLIAALTFLAGFGNKR